MIASIRKTLLVCLFSAPLSVMGQRAISPHTLFDEGRKLYMQQAYGAACLPLATYLEQTAHQAAAEADYRQEAAYMLASASYELHDADCIIKLQRYLDHYPDSPHAHRILALMAAAYYKEGDYNNALAQFNGARLELLNDAERDEMTYLLAMSHLKVGQLKQAAVWLETLQSTSAPYHEDCTFQLAYVRYAQQRYDEAKQGFTAVSQSAKYANSAACYLAEIALLQQQWSQARQLADAYLQQHTGGEQVAQMARIQAAAAYHMGDYPSARQGFNRYFSAIQEAPRRDAHYMMGLASFHCGVYSDAISYLNKVTPEVDDLLTQNAYLHLGLAYLQTEDKNKARMAFEQASAMNHDAAIKEQAAYNHALCIHETSYSAFGESVLVFERFLNEFPSSAYVDKISNYLVEVYLNTRSYDAALQSIDRITHPTRTVLEAKQKILFQLGTQQFTNAQFEQAASYFNQCLALGETHHPTLTEANYWMGETQYRMGQYDTAQSYFLRYLALEQSTANETYALANYNLGYLAFHRKAYTEAINRFNAFLSRGTGLPATVRADAYNRLGDCAFHSRAFDQATAYYRQAEQLQTSVGDYSLYQQAQVYGLQKAYSEKIELLNKLTTQYPQSTYVPYGIYEKGRSYVLLNQATEAIQTFAQLQQRYPEHPVSRKAALEMGLLYNQLDQTDAAIRSYKQVIQSYPGSEEARMAMRDLKGIYVDQNRVDEYVAFTAQLPGQMQLNVSEQDSLTYIAAERSYMRGKKEEAQRSLERYLQQYPQGAFALQSHYYLCLLGQEQQLDELVLPHAEALLNFPTNDYTEEVLPMRATIRFNRKAYADAQSDYQRLQAIATSSSHRQTALIGLLRCSVLLADTTQTIASANQLLSEAKLDPEVHTEALYYRGKALLQNGQTQAALSDLQLLAKDTRTLYGAEAKYLVAWMHYQAKQFDLAEQEILQFIDHSTPHAYWLARSFVLLADVYVATGKPVDARQYLLSLQQNYTVDDDIQPMIRERLEKLKENN